ncbi:hypothetical protein HYH02_006871 [Chlamydomonas schloesseri]|uniref:Uncharacterized protein n=1 Tax=Chlamydomonas schloesseri TaxID=2026947 RepID=A0A835WIQ7_9CHLO|nr:hypothetical protein HYH02_006871 [Chlamydomonas schloesseri]|eukprot:KAG2448287.1 hypothetical protein HYH02_006871 [Chlamydomonas schloesseri]
MAEPGPEGAETEALGTYVNAEDILGDDDVNAEPGSPKEGTNSEAQVHTRSLASAGDAAGSSGSKALPSLDEAKGSRPNTSGEGGVPEQPGSGSGEPVSLPAAPGATRKELGSRGSIQLGSRQSSNQEASTSGQKQPTSPGESLPPINQRAGSSTSKGASRSAGASPQPSSPSRSPIAARTYYKPPPPPPPPPKPKPRERHDTSAVDPTYLNTAVYRTVPGLGRVYDWKLQHDVNSALLKQKKDKERMEKVLEAARVQLQAREANERAFQEWMAAKAQEKQQQHVQSRRINYVTTLYQTLLKEDPVENRERETQWVPNFGFPTGTAAQARSGPLPNDKVERFRL